MDGRAVKSGLIVSEGWKNNSVLCWLQIDENSDVTSLTKGKVVRCVTVSGEGAAFITYIQPGERIRNSHIESFGILDGPLLRRVPLERSTTAWPVGCNAGATAPRGDSSAPPFP